MYSVIGLKREYTETTGFSYEVSEDTSNIGGTCLQASFSEMGIKPMTFKELVGIVGAPTDIMFGDEKSEYTWAIEGKREFYNPQLECDDFETFEFTIYDWRASLYGTQSLETMPVDWHIGGFEPYPTLNSAKRILKKKIKPKYNFNKLPKSISWVQS
tara:strand:- start:100 stop:570 length:471 start_codon:yes stop_codon:yes gene_type:complete